VRILGGQNYFLLLQALSAGVDGDDDES